MLGHQVYGACISHGGDQKPQRGKWKQVILLKVKACNLHQIISYYIPSAKEYHMGKVMCVENQRWYGKYTLSMEKKGRRVHILGISM